MYFINTDYTLRIKTNLNLSAATELVINYTGPFKDPGQWSATADGKDAVYDLTVTRPGIYKMQLVAVIGGLTRRTGYISATFERPI